MRRSPAPSVAERNEAARSAVSAARSVAIVAEPAGLDAGEVEQQLIRRRRLRASRCATSSRWLGLRQRSGLGERILQRAEHQGQGRAKFVTDVGEKGRFRAVDFGESFHSRPRPLISSARTIAAELPGQQLHKAAVIGVGGAVRIEAGDKKSDGRTALRDTIGAISAWAGGCCQ